MSERGASTDLRTAAHAVLLASFAGPVVPDWMRRRIDDGLGGVCLFAGNLTGDGGAAAIAASLRTARADVLVATDEEGGDVTRLWAKTGSPIPGNAALGAVDDVELTADVTEALGRALIAAGVDLVLAPVADINSDPENPVIGVRSFGTDPELVARHVAAAVTGLQRAGVAACAKHFPGHGATRIDSHLELPTVDVPAGVLDRRELVPFRTAVSAGVAAVMTAHLVVPAIDTEPATYSHRVIGELLRGELGFTGAVLTDALDMGAAGGRAGLPDGVVRALTAGADLCCLGSELTDDAIDACVDAIVTSVTSGDLTEDRLHDAASRVARIHRPEPSGPTAGPNRLAALGAQAAFRALRMEGELPDELDAPHVVELDRPPMIAAGEIPWSVGAAIGAEHPGATVERLDPDDVDPADVRAAIQRSEGRPLLVVVRDPVRYPAQARVLGDLLAHRPDAVIVDVGWPVPDAPAAAGRITTFGASTASTRAAARLLAGFELREDAIRG